MMVRKANLITSVAILFSVGLIAFIHHAQQKEILDLKKGVERDLERRELKKLTKEKQNAKELS